jgi:hypothetical protein
MPLRRVLHEPLLRCVMVVLTLLLAAGPAPARDDDGRFSDVPEHIRSWFKSVRSPAGVPCCDVSDGHRTDYDVREGRYWVPIEGSWMPVPDRAVIRDAGNPVGEAVVWYVHHRGEIIISCFVPADAA